MPPPNPEARAKPKVSDRARALALALARRPHRQIAMALLAAVAGLAIAAAGLFHPAAHAFTSVPAGDVALVNQEPILMSDFVTETEQAAGVAFDQTTPAERAKTLREMIDEELLVQRSLALDLPEQDTGSREALRDGVTALVSAPVLSQQPSDDALEAYFNAHRANYASEGSMTLTDLVLHVGGFENADQSVDQAMADAAQAAYELRSGAMLADVEQHFGFVDSGKVSGEQPDFAAKIHLGPKLYAVAQAMHDGEVSEPVADSDGVHLLVMQHRQAPLFADFDSVRNNVYSDYLNAQKGVAEQQNLAFLRRNAQILLAPGQGE